MLPHYFQRIIPHSSSDIAEILESHRLSHDFHRELRHRQAFQAHCQWYRETARQNQQELARMTSKRAFWDWGI